MTRWHKLRYGRVVASCDCGSGDEADALLAPHLPNELIVSDADWRALHHRRALLRVGRKKMGAEQWTHEMRRRANELS